MQIFEYDIPRYSDAERDLCALHKVSDDDNDIETELRQIQSQFSDLYPHLKEGSDFEFPPWHHNLRLFWVYLYADDFYCKQFVPHLQAILQSLSRSWFAEFECYSPALESAELPSGFFGDFLVYRDSVIFCAGDHVDLLRQKLTLP